MKKYLFITIAFLTFLTLNNNVKAEEIKYVNANGVQMTEQEYKNLQSMAFSEDDIYLMSQNEFDNNKGKIGINVVTKVSYIKTVAIAVPKTSSLNSINMLNSENEIIYKDYYLTKEEMDRELLLDSMNSSPIEPQAAASSVKETNYKKLTASIISFMGDQGVMNYRSKADLEWLKMPKYTSEDQIRVHVTDGFMPERSTRYGVQTAKIGNKFERVEYKNNSSKWKADKGDNEEILYTNLINGSASERRIYMYFDAFQYYPDHYDYYRAEAAYNHKTSLFDYDGWIFTTADLKL